MITPEEIQTRNTLIYDCKFFKDPETIKDLRKYYGLSTDEVKDIIATERAKLPNGKREYDSGFRL